MSEREAFEKWWLDLSRVDATNEFDCAFTAWQAACAWQREEDAKVAEDGVCQGTCGHDSCHALKSATSAIREGGEK